VNLALQLIEAGFAAHAGNTGQPLSEWLTQMSRLDRTRHLRIRVTGAAANPIELTGAKRSIGDPVPGWFLWWVAPEPLVVQEPLGNETGGRLTIRIEADSEDEIAEAWRETQGFLTLLLVLACALYLLVHATVGRAFRSVETILAGLEGIEHGDYGKRLPDFPLPEFSRISRAFNHMAAALERSGAEIHSLIHQSIHIQEEERRYLARELHDELGQSLTAIKMMAATLRKSGDTATSTANQIVALCDGLFDVVRSMMRRLRPSMLEELGLAASLDDLVDHWRGLHPDIVVEGSFDPGIDQHIGADRIHLYRIAQECLTNVAKHAGARHVRLEVLTDPHASEIGFECHDDGRGFDPELPRRGFGLSGIRERVSALCGSMTLKSAPGQGTSVEIRIPWREPIL
jgi:two-component system sensor histidine kinase UhpB